MRLDVIHHMTAAPYTIGQHQTVSQAEATMRAHRVRHLPVLHGGALVGLVSDRDLALVTRIGRGESTVEDVMAPTPYTVTSSTSVASVARHMAEHRLGSAVVVDATDHVIGIFTTTDAMNLLARALEAGALDPKEEAR